MFMFLKATKLFDVIVIYYNTYKSQSRDLNGLVF